MNDQKSIESMFSDISFRDPSDVIDEDEQEINDDEVTMKDNMTELEKAIHDLLDMFLQKYPHLNNYKSKPIIYDLCNITVTCMPQYINNLSYYINFIESSINVMKDTNKSIE